jgi:hypothetical protein
MSQRGRAASAEMNDTQFFGPISGLLWIALQAD